MVIKSQISLIITAAIIIIAILFACLWIIGIHPKGVITIENSSANVTFTYKDTNSSLIKLPSEIQNEISYYEGQYHFTIDKWEFDPEQSKQIILYAHDIRNASSIEDLQGKRIGKYTIFIIHDTEFETTRAEVEAYLIELKKNPDYQIARISMITDSFVDPTGHYAELWCDSSTIENKKLDNTTIKGWKILIYPMSPPPTIQIIKTNSSNSSS